MILEPFLNSPFPEVKERPEAVWHLLKFPSWTGGVRGGRFYQMPIMLKDIFRQTYDPSCVLPLPGAKRNANHHCFEPGVLQYGR